MLRAPAVVVALVGILAPTDARADAVAGTRSELLVEQAHAIALTMHPGHAELVVRRTVFNGGDRHDQATFWIDVPARGVAIGLRTLGERNGRPHWYAGELLEAELAAARYRELTGIGGYYPKDPALLSWRSAEQLALQVFPCAPQLAKTIEYTMVAPTEYAEGRHVLVLPPVGTETLPARMRVHAEDRRDQVFVDDEPVGAGTSIELAGEHRIALAEADAPRLRGSLASVPLAEGRALFRYQLDAAAALSEIPRGADVVVLIDRSRSLDAETIAAEVATAHAYLASFTAPRLHARAAVVAFDRRADDLLDGFAPVDEARALLEELELPSANGSHVDVALTHAERLFAGDGRGRTRRILLLTDRASRSRLSLARLGTLARRTGALVHVADVAFAPEDALVRDDGDAWTAVVAPTGGVSWHVEVTGDVPDLAGRRDVLEELARPRRLHALEVRAPGIPTDVLGVPETLAEGEGLHALLLTDRAVDRVIVRGQLWTTPVREVLVPQADAARLWSALVFGSDLALELTEPDMMTLAQRGRAVSPVTSYLAIEPGVRPSTEGLDAAEAFGIGGLGLAGVGHGGGGSAIGAVSPVDHAAILRAHLRDALATCGSPDADARAELETTFAEIVDVVSVGVGDDAVLTDCVTEQLWRVALGSEFSAPRERWSIAT